MTQLTAPSPSSFSTLFRMFVHLTSSKLTATIANTRTLPQLLLCVRHHSSTKLFIAGLSYNTNETVLRDTFEQHGQIIEVKVICDHKTGESKGYGFVRFNSETAATTARKELHGQIVDGRRIRVGYAHKG